jgi:hypothetical protein
LVHGRDKLFGLCLGLCVRSVEKIFRAPWKREIVVISVDEVMSPVTNGIHCAGEDQPRHRVRKACINLWTNVGGRKRKGQGTAEEANHVLAAANVDSAHNSWVALPPVDHCGGVKNIRAVAHNTKNLVDSVVNTGKPQQKLRQRCRGL